LSDLVKNAVMLPALLSLLLLAPPVAEARDQWADSVIGFSSESRTGDADAALGGPDVRKYGNSPKAWSPKSDGAGAEYLAVGFKKPVLATGVRVWESNLGGFVTQIDLLDVKGIWHENVWKGKDGTANAAPVGRLEATFEKTTYLVKGVKIHTKIAGLEQIDAVQLRGTPLHLDRYFGERFRKAGYKFGQNSLKTNVVKIVSGPRNVTMRRKKIKLDRSPVLGPDGKQLPTTGKQWTVESAGYRFKVTIDDDILEDKNPKHRATVETLIRRIKHVPPPYMRVFAKVSDEKKPGPNGWAEDGVAMYYTIGGAGGHGGYKYLNIINDGGVGVLAHEGGHVLESSMTNEEDKTIPKQWQAAIAADAPWSVSGYGDGVWHEDCAEFAQLYATCMDVELGPKPPTFNGRTPLQELRRLSPARFKLWERILYPAGKRPSRSR
jgi:hypothetical protein